MTRTSRTTAAADLRDDRGFPLTLAGVCLDISGERLLGGIDLTLARAPLTVIMGPNGAGKSLLLRLIHGMIDPTAGRIAWNGAPATDAHRKRQAMMFQSPVLLRRSAGANIDFVLKLRGRADPARRTELLEQVGLSHMAQRPARKLSGGEQQRLALARALAMRPHVLFLDEPTASLDPASILMIEEIVRAEQDRGTKVIFVTHDIGQARRLADDVVFLHRGRVLEHTPAAQFFDRPTSHEAREFLAGRIVL